MTYHFWSQAAWLSFTVALFAHGTVGSFFSGTAPHELGHGTVFRTKWLNRLFMHLFSLLSWWDHFDYASSHTYHHRYTMYPDGDRENLPPLEASVSPWVWLQLLTLNLFSKPGRNFGKGGLISTIFVTIKSSIGIVGSTTNPSREWLQALHDDQPAEMRKSMWWSRFMLLFHCSVVTISVLTGLWVLPLLVTFFPFIGNWGAYLVGITQHTGLRDNVADFRKSTRSMTLNPIAEFLYWRMNWHIEHHMYAGVPCYNLKKLAQEISDDMPEPRTLLGAWREMRNTSHRQKEDPSYVFDTPIPESKERIGNEDEDLEGSIGDLAPAGLR